MQSADPVAAASPGPRPVELASVLLVLAASLAPLAIFALAGWPGEPNGCISRDTCFCERFRDGPVRQPANTFSNLGFMAAALAMAVHSQRARRRAPERRNRMTTDVRYAALYVATVAFLGPGSMYLHASMTGWGGKVDVTSMYVFVAFLIAYGVARWRDLSWGSFLALYFALAVGFTVSLLLPISSDVVFGGLVATSALVEGLALRRHRSRTTRKAWLLGAGACFGLAFAIWIPSRSSTGALCAPDSLLQGHALWHLLCAGATGCLYFYTRSEGTRDTPYRS